jgi:phage FluMu gp28-like protein
LPSKRIRGFTPSVVIIDECAFMPEASWQEILPMLKVKRGIRNILIVTSTPFGTQNRFYNIWVEEANNGNKDYPFHVKYTDCPFMDIEKIKKDLEEGIMTEREFKMEYEAEFVEEMNVAIPYKLIDKAFEDYPILEDAELLGVSY